MPRQPTRPRTHGALGTRLLLSVAGLLAALLLGTNAAPAHAHSELEASTPTDNARLAKPPANIKLVFNQEISPQFADLSLSIDSREPAPLTASVDGRQVIAEVPDTLGPARVEEPVPWTVGYRVVSADGHPISGEVSFRAPVPTDDSAATVAPPNPTPETEQEPAPTADDHSPATTDASSDTGGIAILGALVLGGFAAAVGLGGAAWLTRARRRSTDQ